MPRASGRHAKYAYRDHDADVVAEAPPVQNTWYEVFHAYDVRLLMCAILQNNDEVAAKDIEVRWTIDGTVYFLTVNLASGTWNYVYKGREQSNAGTSGLDTGAAIRNAAYDVDKRGLDFKVEIRITSVLGTNQTLTCHCIRETLVET